MKFLVFYSLIKLHKRTKNELYKKEAISIFKGTFDSNVQKLVKEFKDFERLIQAILDAPYSLMEGERRCLVMYYDLIKVILNN